MISAEPNSDVGLLLLFSDTESPPPTADFADVGLESATLLLEDVNWGVSRSRSLELGILVNASATSFCQGFPMLVSWLVSLLAEVYFSIRLLAEAGLDVGLSLTPTPEEGGERSFLFADSGRGASLLFSLSLSFGRPDVGLGGPPLDSLVTSFCSPLRLDNDSGGERDSLAFWFEDFGLASFSDDFERDSEEEGESSVF